MSGGCNIRFDENDDMVIDDIPDDLMHLLEQRAAANGRTLENEMRLILGELFTPASSKDRPRSPLPFGRGLGEGGNA